MPVNVNSINFPDTAFRNFILKNVSGGSNVLTDSQINSCYSMNLHLLGIQNLKGIEFFSKLVTIEIYEPNLSEIDLTNFKELEYLELVQTKIKNIDLSQNINLKKLVIDHNQITELDLSHNKNLQYFFSNLEFRQGAVISATDDKDFPFVMNLKDYVHNISRIVAVGLDMDYSGNLVKLDDNGMCSFSANCANILSRHYNNSFYDIAISYIYEVPTYNGVNQFEVFIFLDPFIINSSLPDAVRNSPYSVKLEAMNVYRNRPGVGNSPTEPLTWVISKGALPPGLTLNPNTGEISGVIS